jgi:hypothetical protein
MYRVLQSITYNQNIVPPNDDAVWFTALTPYIQNYRTGIQYRWDGEQWMKAFEGEYAPGYWGIVNG